MRFGSLTWNRVCAPSSHRSFGQLVPGYCTLTVPRKYLSIRQILVKPDRLWHFIEPRAAMSTSAEKITSVKKRGYEKEYISALRAVRLASNLCQKVQLQLKAGEKTDKADESPVTVADYGAQALVAWSLQQSLPHQAFSMVAEEDSDDLRKPDGQSMAKKITAMVNTVLAEEASAGPLSEADVLSLIDLGRSEGGSQGRHWVLDPIDGTRGFVGMRQYAVCLALLDQGQVVIGMLGCPNLPHRQIQDEDGSGNSAEKAGTDGVGVIFAAQQGAGAFAGPLAGDALPEQRLLLEDVKDFSRVRFMESYESRHSDFDLTAKLAARLGVTRPPLRIDSQAKYGAVARGDAAINLRFPKKSYREKIWDHAPGALIVQEAGAVISDASGAPLDFGRGRWLDLDRGIITSTPAVHAALLEAIAHVSGQ